MVGAVFANMFVRVDMNGATDDSIEFSLPCHDHELEVTYTKSIRILNMSDDNKSKTPATTPAQGKISPVEETAVAEVSDAEIEKVAGGAERPVVAVHVLAPQ